MNKLLFLACCCVLSLTAHTQSYCDTATVEKIVNQQLKKTQKKFRRPFMFAPSGAIPSASEKYPGTNQVYNRHCFETSYDWTGFRLKSKFMKRPGDTARVDYRVVITAPVFNSDLTECRFIVTTLYSEWGGQGEMVYYRRKGKKWKQVKTEALWKS